MNYGKTPKGTTIPMSKPKPKIGDKNEAGSKSPYTVKNGKMVMTGNYASD